MQEDALDHAVLLCRLAHFHQACIRVAAVLVGDVLHPGGLAGDIALILGFVEHINSAPSHGHVYDADLDFFRQAVDQRPAEVIAGAQPGAAAAQRRNGGGPRSLGFALVGPINGG